MTDQNWKQPSFPLIEPAQKGRPDMSDVTFEEATEAARRLIAGAFRRDGEDLPSDRRPRFSIPAQPSRDDDLVLMEFLKSLATEKAAREAAEKRVGELEAERRKVIDWLDDEFYDLGMEVGRGQLPQFLSDVFKEHIEKAEAALAPLQALVDDARRVIEPFAFALSGWEFELAPKGDAEVVAGFYERVITYEHMRGLAAWLSATPTDLLNKRLAEAWDWAIEAAAAVADVWSDTKPNLAQSTNAAGSIIIASVTSETGKRVAEGIRAKPNPHRPPATQPKNVKEGE